MRGTSKRIYWEIEQERPECERFELFGDHECGGRSTMEHVFKYAARQIHRKWNVIRLCAKAHSVDGYQTRGGILDKRINEFIALRHATDEDLAEFPRANWPQLRVSLTHYFAPVK